MVNKNDPGTVHSAASYEIFKNYNYVKYHPHNDIALIKVS